MRWPLICEAAVEGAGRDMRTLVAGLALVNTPSGRMVLVANTGDSLQTFRIRNRE